jgi:excisionase family DNA binding protein
MKGDGIERPYTVKEYAIAARVTPNSVYEMVRRGEVPFVRFGRVIRIPRLAGDRRLLGEMPSNAPQSDQASTAA